MGLIHYCWAIWSFTVGQSEQSALYKIYSSFLGSNINYPGQGSINPFYHICHYLLCYWSFCSQKTAVTSVPVRVLVNKFTFQLSVSALDLNIHNAPDGQKGSFCSSTPTSCLKPYTHTYSCTLLTVTEVWIWSNSTDIFNKNRTWIRVFLSPKSPSLQNLVKTR